MKIKFLGSGGAFVPDSENYHSNILIFSKKETLLFDAGFDIKNSLHYFGISPDFIDNLYIMKMKRVKSGFLFFQINYHM